MKDITPELLEKIKSSFYSGIDSSLEVRRIKKLLDAGNANYATAHDYASELGKILMKAFGDNLSADVLPDGRMYFNIAKRIMESMLGHDHHLVANVASQVQELLNAKAGLGIKALKVPLDESRVAGFVERLANAENFDDVAWILGEPVRNFSQSIIEDVIKANADFHAEAGLKPTIKRIVIGGCCDWCRELAGTYNYAEVKRTGHPVFMRHQHCDCLVTYDPGDGRRQNAHSKRWLTP